MSSKPYSFQSQDLQQIPEFKDSPPDQLNLSHNQLTNIRPLLTFSSLSYLNVSYNQLSELPDLSSLINLKTLNLGNNQVTSLKGIGAVRSLCVLLANDNLIDSMLGMQQCRQLNVLVLSRNKIKKMEGIGGLHKLGKLTISKNQIEEVEGIESLSELRELRLNCNSIQRLKGSCLERMESLLLVDLGNNQIEQFEECIALRGNRYLRDINIQGNPGSFQEEKEPEKTQLLMSWFPNLVVYNSAHAKNKPKRGLSKVTVAKQRSKFMKKVERRKLEEAKENKKEKKRGLMNKVQRLKQKEQGQSKQPQDSFSKVPPSGTQAEPAETENKVEIGKTRNKPFVGNAIKKGREPVKVIKRQAKKLQKKKVLSKEALAEASDPEGWD